MRPLLFLGPVCDLSVMPLTAVRDTYLPANVLSDARDAKES
jgi:hypothetical protein